MSEKRVLDYQNPTDLTLGGARWSLFWPLVGLLPILVIAYAVGYPGVKSLASLLIIFIGLLLVLCKIRWRRMLVIPLVLIGGIMWTKTEDQAQQSRLDYIERAAQIKAKALEQHSAPAASTNPSEP